MSDKHEEMARELLIEWYGRSQPDVSVMAVASALRQVERETLELAEKVALAYVSKPGLSDNPAYVDYNPADARARQIAAGIRRLSLSPTPDVSTPVKLIDLEQSDGYVRVPMTLLDACKTKLQGKENRDVVKWIERVAAEKEVD